MTRLNLGAGKVHFPWTAEKEAARHPLLNVPDTAYEPDWINVDALRLPGINRVVDLFAYPWPWADNSVDEIWCSHICEHIPHEPRMAAFGGAADGDHDYAQARHWERWNELRTLDGFYAFFAECWRVLKPGGLITIVVPYGKSDGALMDPQHTRYLTEGTFHYLGEGGGNSPTYDYSLPLNFKAVTAQFAYGEPYGNLVKAAMETTDEAERQRLFEQLESTRRSLFNVAYEMKVVLEAVK